MANEQTRPYKTLIRGVLEQQTAFSIGGNRPDQRLDSPLAKDGQGRYIIRGAGLAGALIATARRQGHNRDKLKPITQGSPSEQNKNKEGQQYRLDESVWRFHNAHPLDPIPSPEVRQGVGIRQDTGAASEHLLFDVETLPSGARWCFLMEVEDYLCPGDDSPRQIALSALAEWVQSGCLLGRSPARGLGWMCLTEVKVFRLTAEDAAIWPDAFNSNDPWTAAAKLPNKRLEPKWNNGPHIKSSTTLTGTGWIRVGLSDWDAQKSWGLDSLSLGGSAAMQNLQNLDEVPVEIRQDILHDVLHEGRKGQEREQDFTLAWSQKANSGQPKPFIPGSSLRGPLRHALSWWLRGQGIEVWDPVAEPKSRPKETDPVALLFGSTDMSGRLLISDAELVGDYRLAHFEQHAEDEFTGGVFGGSKFDRLALIQGEFRFHFRIEPPPGSNGDQERALIDRLRCLGELKQIPLGGGNWRGHGWVRWELNLDKKSLHSPCGGDGWGEGENAA